MKIELKTDIIERYSEFRKKYTTQLDKALRSSLTKALRVVLNKTKENFKQRVGKSKKKRGQKGKYSDTLLSGIRLGRTRVSKSRNVIYGQVKISQRRKVNNSGAFRLSYLEYGAKPRIAKKSNTRQNKKLKGGLKGRNFFNDAIAQTEREYYSTFHREFEEYMRRK